MKRVLILMLSVFLLTTLCSKDDDEPANQVVQIVFTLDGPQGVVSEVYSEGITVPTDYAVWIEDAQGNFVKTLHVTETVVTVSPSQGSHLEHLASWAAAAGLTYEELQKETEDGIPASLDGLTGATPNLMVEPFEETITVEWDKKDANGNAIDSGIYACFVESANLHKYYVGDDVVVDIIAGVAQMNINLDEESSQLVEEGYVASMTASFVEEGQSSLAKTVVGLGQ